MLRRLPIRQSAENCHFRIHETAEKICAKLGPETYHRFLSFAVVRNPYDHAVSHFEYMKQYRSEAIARQFGTLSFKDYLELRLKRRLPWQRLFAFLPDQAYFVTDGQGKLLVSRVLKYESLQEELLSLLRILKLPAGELQMINRTRARQIDRPTASYYGPVEKMLLMNLYRRDFELFGYARELDH